MIKMRVRDEERVCARANMSKPSPTRLHPIESPIHAADESPTCEIGSNQQTCPLEPN